MTKKKSGAGRKTKIRITKSGKQVKPCPCPIHKGKELPLTEEYFQRAWTATGWQGYCKEYRNRQFQKWYERKKTLVATIAMIKVRSKKKTPGSVAEKSKTPEPEIQVFNLSCPKCLRSKPLNREHWQSNGRGGWRKPCKECLKKKSDTK